MAQRKTQLANDEFYHIYNRGVDKRTTFADKQDFFQFLQMLEYFNNEASLGGLEKYKYPKHSQQRGSTSLLVEILAYCPNRNHFHLLLKQVADDGISRFMQKVGTGYTMYFNKKYKRTGALFGGVFKSRHIDTDTYLDHVGVYVNLNNRAHAKNSTDGKSIHQRGEASLVEYVSSWGEYMGTSELKLCNTKYLMPRPMTPKQYKKFAEDALKIIIKNKELKAELENDDQRG